MIYPSTDLHEPILNNILKQERGTITKQSEADRLRQSKNVNSVDVGDIKIPLSSDQKVWYMFTWEKEVQSNYKKYPRDEKAQPESEYEKMIAKIAEIEIMDKFIRDNPEQFDKAINKFVKDKEKEITQVANKYGYYGNK